MTAHRMPPGGRKGPDEVPFDVGYGNPPKNSQFKPGQSGNPSGRPKGRFSQADAWEKALARTVRVNGPDGPEDLTTGDAVPLAVTAKALKGNIPAARHLAEQTEKLGIGQTKVVRELDEDDIETLMDVLAGFSATGRKL